MRFADGSVRATRSLLHTSIVAPKTLPLFAIDQARYIGGPKAVIYIHHAYVAGAGVQHSQQGGQAFEGGSVADAGGDGDYGNSDQASDYAGESAFHAGADNDDAGFGEDGAVGEETVDAGDSDVVEMLDAVAHEFGGDYGFFGDGDVAGAGGDYRDHSFAVELAVAVEGDGSGERAVDGFGDLGRYSVKLFFSRARGQDIAFVLGQLRENLRHLGGSLALAENHFGHALAEGAVMINFGEAEVFEREMAQTGYRFVGCELFGADIFEETGKGGSVHVMDIVAGPAGGRFEGRPYR
jgi:hypothetical protein